MARLFPNRWDLIILLLVLTFLALMVLTSQNLLAPLTSLQKSQVHLEPSFLPGYAARTSLRMIFALCLSLLFSFIYAPIAAKYPFWEKILIPFLDILQSVPVLGFISITIVFFLSLAPGQVLGAEYAAVFAIFTSQAWNMAFGLYQSLRSIPVELTEAAKSFRLTSWMRFWRLEVPFALPQMVWNMMVSVSGGWFFVVAAEAVTVGNTSFALPGIGSYIALAIEAKDYTAIGWAVLTMAIVIIIFDQILFRPLLAWTEKFRADSEPDLDLRRSWVLNILRKSQLSDLLIPLGYFLLSLGQGRKSSEKTSTLLDKSKHIFIYQNYLRFAPVSVGILICLYLVYWVLEKLPVSLVYGEFSSLIVSGFATMARVFVLLILASLIWVPVGIGIGLNRRLASRVQVIAQLLSAFPANLLFPLVVAGIFSFQLNPNIWLSPLMILGAQWYILFNVIAGAANIPTELRHIGVNLHVRGWLWWQKIALPAIFPYYLTGAIAASGGAWNASIVAEYVKWGEVTLEAQGLGFYIAQAVTIGDQTRTLLGMGTMCILVVTINRIIWRPLYAYAERKFRMI